jgi:hypothetical protein
MTPRGDKALFHGAVAGIIAYWFLAMALISLWGNPLAAWWSILLMYAAPLLFGACIGYGTWKRGEAAARRAQGLCVRCGYNLTGNVSGICPECRTTIP